MIVSPSHCCRRPSRRCYELGVRCGVTWCLAIFSWASDMLLCDLWTRVGFPYWHCFWHVLIFLASYSVCVLFAYIDALTEVRRWSRSSCTGRTTRGRWGSRTSGSKNSKR